MNDVRFAQSFKKLVEVNGNVQPRETVVIVTDYSMTDIARQLAVAARATGAQVTVCMMEQRKIMDAGKKKGNYRKAQISVAAWEEFMLGCDPAWHEHKGNIKQEDD